MNLITRRSCFPMKLDRTLWSHGRRRFATSTFQFLSVEENRDNHSVRITLNRPELHNAFNDTLISELVRAFSTVADQYPRCRSVVLAGAGQSFSAGADLNWMRRMAEYTEAENQRDAEALYAMFAAIRTCPVPVIARVHGAALGGGSGLVAACDIAFALRPTAGVKGSGALFGFTEVKLGLIPAVISPFVMEKIGPAHASRYFLTGQRFRPDEAQRIGLVSDTAASESELDELVGATCAELVSSGPEAVRACKRLMHRVVGADPVADATRDYVTHQIAAVRVSSEGQQGLRAFLSKNKPAWQT